MCYREVKEIEEYRAVERAELRDAVNAQKRLWKAWDLRWIRCLSSPIQFTYNLDAFLRDF